MTRDELALKILLRLVKRDDYSEDTFEETARHAYTMADVFRQHGRKTAPKPIPAIMASSRCSPSSSCIPAIRAEICSVCGWEIV